MTLQDYVLFITTQPLLLRLSIAAILVLVIVAARALTQRVLRFRQSPRATSAAIAGHDRPQRIIGTVLYD